MLSFCLRCCHLSLFIVASRWLFLFSGSSAFTVLFFFVCFHFGIESGVWPQLVPGVCLTSFQYAGRNSCFHLGLVCTILRLEDLYAVLDLTSVIVIATGVKPSELSKPQIGIGSMWFDGNPCNMHLNDLYVILLLGHILCLKSTSNISSELPR